jgi:hypothetical protein
MGTSCLRASRSFRPLQHADTRILARYQDVVSELQRDAVARMDELLGG